MSDVLSTLSDGLAAAVETAGQSVVRVDARQRMSASGIVWSADGLIVTAHHVVERDDPRAGCPDRIGGVPRARTDGAGAGVCVRRDGLALWRAIPASSLAQERFVGRFLRPGGRWRWPFRSLADSREQNVRLRHRVRP